jgi:ribosomal protein S8
MSIEQQYYFIGSWQLIPERSVYSASVPPKQLFLKIGVINIWPLELSFDFNWYTHDNQSLTTAYTAIANGELNAFSYTQVAEQVQASAVSRDVLELKGFINETLAWHTTYEVNAKGLLTAQQSMMVNGVEQTRYDVFQKQLSVLPYANSVSGVAIVPTAEGTIKHKALQAMAEQTDMHLLQIREQIEVLARQANEIMRRKELSMRIYESRISFVPQIGQVYHLYEKNDGLHVLSLVSPNEWGGGMPYKSFAASVRLLADHTWTEA